jgi:hypothetical protein
MISLQPFTFETLDRFAYSPHRRAIAQCGGPSEFADQLRRLCERSEVSCGVLDERILFIAGLRIDIVHLGKPVSAEIWASPCAGIHRYAKEVWRGAKAMHTNGFLLSIPRVWATVVHDTHHNMNANFLEKLGYQREGTLHHYDHEGRTYSLYARIHAPGTNGPGS